jgi:hypothetical protein
MNAIQTQQWNDFACMSNALIVAAAVKGIALTADDYRAKYEHLFPFTQTNYGGLILSRFYQIARGIGLGTEMDLIWPYDKVKEHFDKKILVFVFSGLHLDPNRTDPFSHVSLLRTIDQQKFAVHGFPLDLDAGDWVKKRCCGIIVL